ncbi:MAG: phenylalanine--tRNA ligase subunit beta [Chloroflexi bacterium]|nr:phenylalanine--tRNA ligase subunit beta [Chloroflexota bacterium]
MKVPLPWLRDFVRITVPVSQLERLLTAAGLEVEEIAETGSKWDGLVVGKIVALEPHPNADRLQVAQVDVGGDQLRTIVCGAHNIAVGQTVPVVLPGGHIGDTIIEQRKVRGVESQGMMCSPRELEISDDHSGILILEDGPAPGSSLSTVLGDQVLDIYVTPNRPDCLSIRGIAREIAALLAQSVCFPTPAPVESAEDTERAIAVEIMNSTLCRRYAARLVRGAKVGPSPNWLRARLEACGVRSINNIVDVSNYVMLEFGQPLHIFDFAAIHGERIVVRSSLPGEKITTLDGSERSIPEGTLLICDAERPVALAGVMGGANSEVSGSTTDVLIESASFSPTSIRTTSRSLNLRSEASLRFERNIDPEYVLPALDRAAEMIASLTGGIVLRGAVDVYPAPEPSRAIQLSLAGVNGLLGTNYSGSHVRTTLERLGFIFTEETQTSWTVSVPSYRRDVTLAVDLIEDVARITGYDQIPTTLPSTEQPATHIDDWFAFEERLRTILVGLGLTEVVSYALTSKESLSRLLKGPAVSLPGEASDALPVLRPADLRRCIEHGVTVRNPLSPDWSTMRVSLLDSALRTLATNAASVTSRRLFEIGRVYENCSPQELPRERAALVIALSGAATEPSWQQPAHPIDFWDLKGAIEGVFAHLAVIAPSWVPCVHPSFHPGRTASLTIDGRVIGVAGELHPRCASAYGLSDRSYLAEIDLEQLVHYNVSRALAVPSRFPSVPLDVAFIVRDSVPAAAVLESVARAAGSLCRQVRLFDLYTGQPVPQGHKSLALNLVFQAADRTLTVDEVNSIRDHIRDQIARDIGAVLRDS